MIDVIDLKKSFGKNEVLKGIDIKINKGDVVVVIGPSGSGKSTFLRCLNCMEDPTGGQIIFNGVDIADPRLISISTAAESEWCFSISIFLTIKRLFRILCFHPFSVLFPTEERL